MPMAHIVRVGDGDIFHVHFISATDPGFGGGRPGGADPGYGRPEGGRPSAGLPGSGARPDHDLPGSPGHPANRPPGSGGGIPDNELPDHAPPQVAAGQTLVLVRGPAGHWVYATLAPGSPPPRPMPTPPPARPDNTLPPTAQPKPAE